MEWGGVAGAGGEGACACLAEEGGVLGGDSRGEMGTGEWLGLEEGFGIGLLVL